MILKEIWEAKHVAIIRKELLKKKNINCMKTNKTQVAGDAAFECGIAPLGSETTALCLALHFSVKMQAITTRQDKESLFLLN